MLVELKKSVFLIACVALMGCGATETSLEDGSLQVTGPTDRVSELPKNAAPSHLNYIEGLYELPSGEWIGLENALDLSETKPSRPSYAFLRSSADGFKAVHGPVLTDTSVSDLFRTGESSFLIAGLTSKLKDDGTIAVASHIVDFKFEQEKVKVSKEEFPQFTIDTKFLDNGSLAPEASARERRKKSREAYEDYFLIFGGGSSPRFLPNGKAQLFIPFLVESGVYSLGAHTFYSVELLTNDWDRYELKPVPCSSIKTNVLVLRGAREAFVQFYPPLVGKGPPNEQIFAAFGSAGSGRWLLHDETVVSHGTFNIQTCTYMNDTLYAAGSFIPQNEGATRATLFVQDAGHSRFVKLGLPRKSFVSALKVNPESGEILIGGSQNYSQAPTGSVSFMTGFVASFAKDLTFRWLRNLEGARTTRVSALDIQKTKGSETVLVGGTTNAPSTHDSDRSSRSFIHTIH